MESSDVCLRWPEAVDDDEVEEGVICLTVSVDVRSSEKYCQGEGFQCLKENKAEQQHLHKSIALSSEHLI